jgi:hypothetical protein
MSMRGAEGNGATVAEGKERRASDAPRVQFEALVAVGENGGGGFEAESVDVSPDGMRLRTAYLPEVGDKLVCRFDGMGHELTVDGEVMWRNEEAKGGEFGLRFKGLTEATEEAVKAMCTSLGPAAEEPVAGDGPSVPRGSRVRLHIEGLGSPMKARVRESASREVEVGSNLEFLKVGRTLELEDVEQGKKREALIDSVKVDVDPVTNVPQLVVTLRYDTGEKAAPAKKKAEKPRASVPPTVASKRSAEPAKTVKMTEVNPEAEEKAEAHDDDGEGEEQTSGPSFGARAASAGRTVASKIAPALTTMSASAKGAMNGMLALIERRKAVRDGAKKSLAPRRTTAPAPGGGITTDGKRLVRDDGGNDDEAPRPRTNHRAALMGGGLGLIAVLAIFGMTRMLAGKPHATAEARATATALPAASGEAYAPAGSGTPVANVPLFGATPLSTTEPLAPAPSAQASAAPGLPDGAPGADDDDGPGASGSAQGPLVKEWGKGEVGAHPVVLRIKMDGPIEKITGSAGAQGFTIAVPSHRSMSSNNDLARKDKRLASVNVVNTSRGAEVSVQFKDDVPSYQAKIKGDKLEISIAKAGPEKVAKKKGKGKKKKHQ